MINYKRSIMYLNTFKLQANNLIGSSQHSHYQPFEISKNI